jgi:hypothetical protein
VFRYVYRGVVPSTPLWVTRLLVITAGLLITVGLIGLAHGMLRQTRAALRKTQSIDQLWLKLTQTAGLPSGTRPRGSMPESRTRLMIIGALQ